MKSLFLLAVLLSASATDPGYSGVKAVISGYMSGFLGEPYTLSEKCLDADT